MSRVSCRRGPASQLEAEARSPAVTPHSEHEEDPGLVRSSAKNPNDRIIIQHRAERSRREVREGRPRKNAAMTVLFIPQPIVVL